MLDDGLAMRDRTALAYIDSAFENEGKTGSDFARLHDQGAVGEMADFAETAQPRDVMILQSWKHLVAAGFEKRGVLSHDPKRTKARANRHP
jgi:hypothetical protein